MLAGYFSVDKRTPVKRTPIFPLLWSIKKLTGCGEGTITLRNFNSIIFYKGC